MLSQAQHAVVAVQDQARRHVHAQQPEEHPGCVQCADIGEQLGPGDEALPPGHEEADPVDRCGVDPLPGEYEPEHAGQDGRHEVVSNRRVEDQSRQRRKESVRDVDVESPGAAVREGRVDLGVRGPDIRPDRRGQYPLKRNPGGKKLDGRSSAGFTLPLSPVFGAFLDIVPFEEQAYLPIANHQIRREKQAQQAVDDVEIADDIVSRSDAEQRQKHDRQCGEQSGCHPGLLFSVFAVPLKRACS